MGATLGGVGSKLMPGLLGNMGADTTGQIANNTANSMLGQNAVPVTDLSTKAPLFDQLNYQSGGLLGQAADGLNSASKYTDPIMKGVQIGQSMRQQSMVQPPPMTPPSASPSLAQLANQNQQMDMQQMQNEQMQRELMRQRIRAMGMY